MIAHIAAQRAEHNIPVRVSCRALGMSESWFYKQHNHPEAARSKHHQQFVAAVNKAFKASAGTYGSPRIVVDLWEAGRKVSVNRDRDHGRTRTGGPPQEGPQATIIGGR